MLAEVEGRNAVYLAEQAAELTDALQMIGDTLSGLAEHFGVDVNVSDGPPAAKSNPPRR